MTNVLSQKNLLDSVSPTAVTVPMFPTPLGIFNLGRESEELNRNLIRDALHERNISDGISKSNFRGWHSDKYMERRYDSYQQFATFISKAANHFVTGLGFQGGLETENVWANLSGPGAFNNPHHHHNDALAGVYYPSQWIDDGVPTFNWLDKNQPATLELGVGNTGPGGALVLMDPAYGTRVNLRKSKATEFVQGQQHIYPVSGLLILFPSYLVHYVTPFTEDRTRMSVSFRCFYPD